MKGKVVFNSSGSTSAKLVIPSAFVELLKITPIEREVNITFKDDALIISKIRKVSKLISLRLFLIFCNSFSDFPN